MTRVIHVVLNNFNPDYRVLKEVISLRKKYSDVHVIALMDKEKTMPSTEIIEGVKVHRININSRIFRGGFSLPFKYIESVVKIVKYVKNLRPDIIHVHDRMTLLIGYLIKRVTKAKMIYDSHEFWEDSNVTYIYPKIVTWFLTRQEHFFARRSSAVITVSDGIASLIENRMKVPSPIVIKNAPYSTAIDINNAKLNVRKYFGLSEDVFLLIYVGGILPTRGVDQILKAFNATSNDNVHLIFLGNKELPNWLTSQVNISAVENRIHCIPPVHPLDVIDIAAQADLGIHAIRGESLSHKYCLPNKLFEYIQSGLALLVTNLPEMEKIINEYEIGSTFKDGDIDDLINKLEYLIKNRQLIKKYKENSIKLSTIMDWSTEELKLLSLYEEVENQIGDKKSSG